MMIVWSHHARERFLERSLKYGINYAEIEQNVLQQKIKINQGNTIKTVFKVLDYYFTVIKEETKSLINIVSIWEASDKEVELCLKK